MEPVAPAENNSHNTVYPDRRRRRAPNPSSPAAPVEHGDSPAEDDDSHNLDEHA